MFHAVLTVSACILYRAGNAALTSFGLKWADVVVLLPRERRIWYPVIRGNALLSKTLAATRRDMSEGPKLRLAITC